MKTRQIAPNHADHDLLLIAAHVAGDASPDEADWATTILATCVECRQVASDLAAITTASQALPAPRRSRDFRLTPDQAAGLRHRSIGSRIAAALLDSRGPARALPAALMTIGLAALLVSTMPGLPGAGAPAARDLREQVFTSPTAAPTGDARTGAESVGAPDAAKSPGSPSGAPQLAPPAVTDGRTSAGAGSTSAPVPASQGGALAPKATSSAAPVVPAPADKSPGTGAVEGPSPRLGIAFVSLLAGLFLLILRRAGPRATA
jgi:hypothetical protein